MFFTLYKSYTVLPSGRFGRPCLTALRPRRREVGRRLGGRRGSRGAGPAGGRQSHRVSDDAAGSTRVARVDGPLRRPVPPNPVRGLEFESRPSCVWDQK